MRWVSGRWNLSGDHRLSQVCLVSVGICLSFLRAVFDRHTKTHGPHILNQNKTEQVKPSGLHESVHLGSHRMYLKIFNLVTIPSEK